MLNYAPNFILRKLRHREITGGFHAAVLLADIKGFTSRFDEMAKLGPKGAEQISFEVSETLSNIVKVCSEFDGFPVSFGGDAVTIVFEAGLENAQFAQKRIQSTNSTATTLPVNVSIAEGSVIWDLITLHKWTFFCFQGSALREALIGSQNNDQNMYVKQSHFEKVNAVSTQSAVVESFNSPVLFARDVENEFRQVTSIFVSMENRTDNRYSREFIKLVLEVAEETGGYVSGLEPNIKGYSILVVFGAPISREDDSSRADLFLENIFREASGRVKAGVATGNVFSGLLKTPLLNSYTVLGPSVNLAARLHDAANWNSILSEFSFSYTSRLGILDSKELKLKGIELPVALKVLSPWKKRVIAKNLIPPLIERNKILDNLSIGLLESSSTFLVIGATGMGKTRLATELGKKLSNTTILYIHNESSTSDGWEAFSRLLKEWFGASSEERSVAEFKEKLYSFVELLDNLNKPEAEKISTELLRAESILAAMIGVYWEKSLYQGLDPATRFQNTVSVISAFIQGHCMLQKTTLIIDDVQWMDSDSITLFSEVLKRLGTFSPSILLLARPGIEKILSDMQMKPEVISLTPLTRVGTGRFLEWALDCKPSEKLLSWFHERTEGIPFFMEQYAQVLTSNEELPNKADFPGSIHALLVSKLDRFTPEFKNLALDASVLGRVFDPVILELVSQSSGFQYLLETGVKERIWQRTSDGLFSFVHVLFRESAYNLQLHSRKLSTHNKIAQVMKTIWKDYQEKATNIAFHFELSEENEEASLWYLKAGLYSSSKSMIATSHEQITKVLALSKDITRRLDAYNIMFDLLVLKGSWELAEELIKKAFSEELLPSEKARVKLMQANLAVIVGNPSEAKELLKGIVEENAQLRVDVHLLNGRILMLQGKTEEARIHFLNSYETLKSGTVEEQLKGIKALGNASGCYLRLGRREEAEGPLKIVLNFAIETGNLILETLAVGNLALVYKYLSGRGNDAIVMNRRHLELARKTGSKVLELQAVGNLGSLLEYQSSSREAFTLLETAVELAEEYGGNESISTSLANLAMAYAGAGKLERALELYSASLSVCFNEGIQMHQVDYLLGVVDVLIKLERYDEAWVELSQLDTWSFDSSYVISILIFKARLSRLQNNNQKALKLLQECAELNPEDFDFFEFLLEKYLITGDKTIFARCVELGEQLFRRSPHWKFRERLDKLIKLKD